MSEKKPLIHILVIGFHHKRGCQVNLKKNFLSHQKINFLFIFFIQICLG